MENTKREEIEAVILAAAKKVFIQKGFRGATMRDIAKEAGVNLAMLNYYFQSKDCLFDIVFEDSFLIMSRHVLPVITSDLDVKTKIREFINVYVDGLLQNPSIPQFFMKEVVNDPQRLLRKIWEKEHLAPQFWKFWYEIEKEGKEGKIRSFDPFDLIFNTVSLCVFPFMMKPILSELRNMDEETFSQMLLERKKSITEFVLSAIEIKE